MRPLVALLLLVPLVPVAGADGAWVTLLEDPSGDATFDGGVPMPLDGRVDLLRVEAQDAGELLRVRLETREESLRPTPDDSRSSEVRLRLVTPTGARDVTLRVDTYGFHVEGAAQRDAMRSGEGWPYRWTMELDRAALLGLAEAATLRVVDAHVAWASGQGIARDDGRGEGELALAPPPAAPPGAAPPTSQLPRWREITGPDFAGGPSVAVGRDGTAHLAYFVYKSELLGGARPGLYHATLAGGRLQAERLADVTMPGPIHQDGNSTTAIAVDDAGVAHILYYPQPWKGAGIRYVTSAGAAPEDPSVGAKATDDVRSSASIAARGGRVVAAFQAEGEKVAVVERVDGAWRELIVLSPARHGRVEIAPDGKAHVAWMRPTEDGYPSRGLTGDLLYASEADGWREVRVARGVEELTRFWARAEADGTFTLALDERGTPHLAWEAARGQRGVSVVSDGKVTTTSLPLDTTHGNMASRMRMAFDGLGRAHVARGYGGLDAYGVRSAEGGWAAQEMDRGDVFSLAALPDGRAIIVSTQPHGGTTLSLRIQSTAAADPAGEEGRPRLPVPLAAPLALAAVVAAAALARRAKL